MVNYFRNEQGNKVVAANHNAFIVVSNNSGMFNLQIFMFPFTRPNEVFIPITEDEFRCQYDVITSLVIDIISPKGKGVCALLPDAKK